jgi:hypothetical protein
MQIIVTKDFRYWVDLNSSSFADGLLKGSGFPLARE